MHPSDPFILGSLILQEDPCKYHDSYLSLTNENSKLNILLINRIQNRKIVNFNEILSGLHQKYINSTVEMIHYEHLSFIEQVNRTRSTDILIAVHGAGDSYKSY